MLGKFFFLFCPFNYLEAVYLRGSYLDCWEICYFVNPVFQRHSCSFHLELCKTHQFSFSGLRDFPPFDATLNVSLFGFFSSFRVTTKYICICTKVQADKHPAPPKPRIPVAQLDVPEVDRRVTADVLTRKGGGGFFPTWKWLRAPDLPCSGERCRGHPQLLAFAYRHPAQKPFCWLQTPPVLTNPRLHKLKGNSCCSEKTTLLLIFITWFLYSAKPFLSKGKTSPLILMTVKSF